MIDYPTTCFSRLSDHDWRVERSRWMRGLDWAPIRKLGRKWIIDTEAAKGLSMFATKTAAYRMYSDLIISESHIRAEKAA